MKHSICALMSLVLVLGASSPTALAQPRDPSLEWRTLDTPHFSIHYYVPLGRLARRVAHLAERSHENLVTLLGYQNHQRTHFVLTDESDFANGSATALPFNTVRLFATAPADMSLLGDYDDWMHLLISHEYTHVLHLDQWGGIARIINAIFGKVYAPNHVQPRWFIEGVAVWIESRRSSGGRLRSSMFDMYLRSDILEGRAWDLDQISNDADRWPHGHAWYLYGAFFVQYIVDRFGEEAIRVIAREYGNSTLPYGLNRVALRATGITFSELYEDFLNERRTHYRTQLASIESRGRIEGQRLTTHGEVARSPRFTNDGRVFYQRSDNRTRPRIVSFSLNAPTEQETWVRTVGLPGAAYDQLHDQLYFARADNFRDIYLFNDLFRLDLESQQITRLTQGMRVREPDVSPDGRRLAFIINDTGTTHLMLSTTTDIETSAEVLVRSETDEQVFTPRFSPDGQAVAYATWTHGGYRDIHIVELPSRRILEVTHDQAIDSGPCWSPDGEYLYFSSDRDGVANIYRYRLSTGTIQQITNVASGAYHPAISPNGEELVYLGYTSFGFDLFHLHLNDSIVRPSRQYRSRRDRSAAPAAGTLFTGFSRPYNPGETLYPRSYLIDLRPDAFGPSLGLQTSGADLANWHRWSLQTRLGFVRGNWNFDASYRYQRHPLGVNARLFRQVGYAGGFEIGGRNRAWPADSIGGSLGIDYRIWSTFYSHRFSANYQLFHRERADLLPGRLDPNDPPPIFPIVGWIGQLQFGWSYSDVERYTYDISDSNGREIRVGINWTDPIWGAPYQAAQLTWSIRQYLTMPWLQHHVLALHLEGGLSIGDENNRDVFFLGGLANRNLLMDLINLSPAGGVALRGYAPFDRQGLQYHLAQIEYRFPVWRINRGLSTLPLYLNRLHAAVFSDVGDAFFGDINFERFRIGVGAEALLDFTLGYQIALTLRLGYARGLMDGGIDQAYAQLGIPF